MLLRSLITILAVTTVAAGAAQVADVELVTIPVTVTDRSGDSVTQPLTTDHFRVREDGREQTILSVEPGPGPVSLSIVLDSADSMVGVPQRLGQQAVRHLVRALAPEDEVSLVMYRDKVIIAAPWTKAAAFPEIDWTAWQTMPSGEVLNAVRNGLFMMDLAAHPRRAVVAISSTDEVASPWPLAKYVVSKAQSETAIYGLRTEDYAASTMRAGDTGIFAESRGALVSFDDLLRDGGGRALPLRTTDDAERNAQRLIDELRMQYVIRYAPSRPLDGSYRRLKVDLRNADGLRIRHRLGYLARPSASPKF
jgi:VWFA-related protein